MWSITLATTQSYRGGRKQDARQNVAEWAPRTQVDNAMVKALARAFRWRKMLDEGEIATIRDLAQREKVSLSYAARVLQLTFLAPDLVEGILEGRMGQEFGLEQLRETLPVDWGEQRRRFR